MMRWMFKARSEGFKVKRGIPAPLVRRWEDSPLTNYGLVFMVYDGITFNQDFILSCGESRDTRPGLIINDASAKQANWFFTITLKMMRIFLILK
jgi:hypothetical protein